MVLKPSYPKAVIMLYELFSAHFDYNSTVFLLNFTQAINHKPTTYDLSGSNKNQAILTLDRSNESHEFSRTKECVFIYLGDSSTQHICS